MKKDYDRYEFLKRGGQYKMMPFVEISKSNTDKYIEWNSNFNRLDKLSNKYFGNPFYDFFILYANPEFLSEWDIPDGTIIRIPFPLDRVKAEYERFLSEKFKNN
ncbi:MAG: hypothetical protein ACOC2W_03480 [bacterium]